MKIAGTISAFLCAMSAVIPLSAEPALDAKDQRDSEIILGSSAKRLCSSLFVSGRSLENIMAEELDNPALAEVDFQVGEDWVSAAAKGMRVQAIYRGPLGCTLVKGKSPEALQAEVDVARILPLADDNGAEWPLGNRVELPKDLPGVDLHAVNTAVEKAFQDIEADQDINTRAVLVVHQGKVIAERYAAPFHAEMPQLGWSMAKTVTGALTGMMADDDLLDIKALAPVRGWQGDDDFRSAITLEDLLQMSSGLAFSEVYTSGSMSDVILMLYTTGDTGGFAAAQPLQHSPGSHWSYSSGTSNIIARLQREQFEDIHDYLNYPREKLFSKLGMNSAVMEPDASGVYVGSSYLYATPRDWAKFALLYLQDGVWNGERVLPKAWVDYATTPASAAPQGNYGAQIWLNAGAPGNPADRPMPSLPASMYYLSGFEGQNILIFPEQDLIVMRMGLTTSGPRPVWTLAEEVLAALE